MRVFGYIVTCLFVASLFSECRRYSEDDELIHFRKVVKRIEGGYIIESYKVDGMDCTYVVPKTSTFNLSYSYYVDFRESQYNYYIRGDIGGSWELSRNKKNVTIYAGASTSQAGKFNPFYPNREWQIRRLDNDQFWIRSSASGKLCELKFKKVVYAKH